MIAHLWQPFNRLCQHIQQRFEPPTPPPTFPTLSVLPLTQPFTMLPPAVQACPIAARFYALLAPLPWATFPERSTERPWPGSPPRPRAPFVAAYLVKLHEGHTSMGQLRRYLLEHPALAWLLGFPVSPQTGPQLPSRRQLSRVLRDLPSSALSFLFEGTIQAVRDALPAQEQALFGDTIAGDTKHILGWVKQNNPKVTVGEGRWDKTRQPKGDRDCRLGIKKRRNSSPEPSEPSTPSSEPLPKSDLQIGADILWGYASGIVVTPLGDAGAAVLAEYTQPFNASDSSYFQPLMAQTERHLGRRPRFGTWDAAFDAFWIYDYFHEAGGMAAVPLRSQGPARGTRTFDALGQPQCAAGLGMPLLLSYQDRTSNLVPHVRGKHGCPLLHPQPTGAVCPIADPHWEKGGCTTTIARSEGARLRWQLDRESTEYRALYKQRTVVERVNSQALALGIERPKLRSKRAITNQTTLIYVLLNLRTLRRLHERQTAPKTMLAA